MYLCLNRLTFSNRTGALLDVISILTGVLVPVGDRAIAAFTGGPMCGSISSPADLVKPVSTTRGSNCFVARRTFAGILVYVGLKRTRVTEHIRHRVICACAVPQCSIPAVGHVHLGC